LKHEDTKTRSYHKATHPPRKETQSRKGAKSQSPPTYPAIAETQRRRDAEGCMPRFIARRGPGRRTARDRRTGGPLQPQAVVAAPRTADLRSVERRPRRFPPDFHDWKGLVSSTIKEEERWNRRAPGASAGGKPGCDERLRSKQTGFPQVVGDRTIADVFAGNLRHCRITSVATSLRLRAFAPLRFFGCAGVSASLRLPASAFCFSAFAVRIGVSNPGLIGL
jgi:hypothetical protein